MNIFEKIRDIWEIVVIERFPRVIRNRYYTKVTKWPKEFDKESLLRFVNSGYIRRRFNSLTNEELKAYIEKVRDLGIL